MNGRISIQGIADEAGVSTATVSRVINFPEKVKPQTRAQVEAVIRKYQYQPNVLAQGLRSSSMPIIGVMVPDISNEFFANIVIHLQQELFNRGYWTMICNSNKSKSIQQSYLKLLMDQNLSGLVFIASDSTSLELPIHVPTVFVDRYPVDADMDVQNYALVESDNHQGGYLATEELIRCGCRRIAFITSLTLIRPFMDRMQGYWDALKAHGLPVDEELILKMGGISDGDGEEAIRRLLGAGIQFDGVFAAADIWAVGALQCLKRYGMQVPERIKMIGFDDQSYMAFCDPKLSSVHQHPEQLALTAARVLIEMIGDRGGKERNHRIPIWVARRASSTVAD